MADIPTPTTEPTTTSTMPVPTTVDPGKHYLMQSIIYKCVYITNILVAVPYSYANNSNMENIVVFFSGKYPVVATKARAQSRAGF